MRVAITGWAIASPFGTDPEAFWNGICHGPAPISRWIPEPGWEHLDCPIAPLPDRQLELPANERTVLLADDLIRRTLLNAGFDAAPEGTGLALGSCWLEGEYLRVPRPARPPAILPRLATTHDLHGPVTSPCVACCSGNLALAWALDRLRDGEAPFMLAGGLDVGGAMAIGGYLYLGTMTDTEAKPFDQDRDGFLLGEGGAMFLLEPLEQARAAGRRVYAELVSAGTGHDAAHPTRPASDGRGMARAMRTALAEADLEPGAIGYLNAHAPGTPANEPCEAAAINSVFGARGVPVSSTKGALGHAQGGANALEAAACLMALDRQVAPPTVHLETPDESLELDLITEPRAIATDHALSIASSMGGASCVVIFRRGDA